jgi:hypothetical protein
MATLNNIFYWDSLLWYFDVMQHTLGGLWVGMFFFYVFSTRFQTTSYTNLCIAVVLSTILIGVLWEGYEYYIYQIISKMNFDIVDTIYDVFNDIVGSLLACWYFAKLIMPKVGNRLKSNNGQTS